MRGHIFLFVFSILSVSSLSFAADPSVPAGSCTEKHNEFLSIAREAAKASDETRKKLSDSIVPETLCYANDKQCVQKQEQTRINNPPKRKQIIEEHFKDFCRAACNDLRAACGPSWENSMPQVLENIKKSDFETMPAGVDAENYKYHLGRIKGLKERLEKRTLQELSKEYWDVYTYDFYEQTAGWSDYIRKQPGQSTCLSYGVDYKTCCADFAESCATGACKDTDNGDYAVQGTVSFKDITQTDECRDSRTLIEYSCNAGGGFSKQTRACGSDEKCEEGACVKNETACIDSLEINAIKMFSEDDGIYGHGWFCMNRDCGKTKPFVSCHRFKDFGETRLSGRCCYGFYPSDEAGRNLKTMALSRVHGEMKTADIGNLPDATKAIEITKDQFSRIVAGISDAQNVNYNAWGSDGFNCVTWVSHIINPILIEKGFPPITAWTPNGLIEWIKGSKPSDKAATLSCGMRKPPAASRLKEFDPSGLSATAGTYLPFEGEHIFSTNWLAENKESDIIRNAYGRISYK